MKLIQLNAWFGQLYWPLRRFLDREQPDLLLAQELLDSESGPKFECLTARGIVAEELLPHSANGPGVPIITRYGIPQQYCLGIFARRPLPSAVQVVLHDPAAIAATPKLAYYQPIHTTVAVNDRTLHLLSHHGAPAPAGSPDGGRRGTPQAEQDLTLLSAYIAGLDGPVILAGDFNLWPDAAPLRHLQRIGLRNLVTAADMSHGRNANAWRPDEIVSHVFVSPEIKVQRFEVLRDVVSDHNPLLLEFEV